MGTNLGLRFSGMRLFLLTTWVALLLALIIAIFYLRDHTVVDATDPEPQGAGVALPGAGRPTNPPARPRAP